MAVAKFSDKRGEGESLVMVGGNDHVGTWAWGNEFVREEEEVFRSDMSPCKACDDNSGSSDSDILGICKKINSMRKLQSPVSLGASAFTWSARVLATGPRDIRQMYGG